MGSTIFGRYLRGDRPRRRESGRPTSSNGAASQYLFWELSSAPLQMVAVTLTVTQRPRTDDLYFWALQVSFVDKDTRVGAGHLGLQHHAGYPAKSAANWGGYDRAGDELSGDLLLPRSLGNPNTGNYRWSEGVRYRLRIEPGPANSWRGSITDLASGNETVVRDLQGGGSALAAPMVWSEVFAPCDARPAAVRWADPVALTSDGTLIEVSTARVGYQSVGDGGCSNTTAQRSSEGGIAQVSATRRIIASDTTLHF